MCLIRRVRYRNLIRPMTSMVRMSPASSPSSLDTYPPYDRHLPTAFNPSARDRSSPPSWRASTMETSSSSACLSSTSTLTRCVRTRRRKTRCSASRVSSMSRRARSRRTSRSACYPLRYDCESAEQAVQVLGDASICNCPWRIGQHHNVPHGAIWCEAPCRARRRSGSCCHRHGGHERPAETVINTNVEVALQGE